MAGADHPGDALSGLLDGELEPATAAAVEAHVARCPGCTLELDEVASARAALRGLPPVDPPSHVLRPAAPGPVARRRPLLGVAAALALVLGGGSVLVALEPASPPVAVSAAGPGAVTGTPVTASLLGARRAGVVDGRAAPAGRAGAGRPFEARVRRAAARVLSLVG